MAKLVFSVAILNGACTESPTPPPTDMLEWSELLCWMTHQLTGDAIHEHYIWLAQVAQDIVQLESATEVP
jgi:hypothetical protein